MTRAAVRNRASKIGQRRPPRIKPPPGMSRPMALAIRTQLAVSSPVVTRKN